MPKIGLFEITNHTRTQESAEYYGKQKSAKWVDKVSAKIEWPWEHDDPKCLWTTWEANMCTHVASCESILVTAVAGV
jgi:hypothetical protein